MASANNISIPQQQFGIKVARPGYNALTAPDYGLLFNSSWPSLAVAYEETITLVSGKEVYAITHNLGFYPLTMAWITINGKSYGRLNYKYVSMTTSEVFLTIGDSVLLSEGATITVRCYNTDISQETVYPLPKSAVLQGSYDPNYGFKVAKQGKDVNSRDLNDFIIHTKGQSPAILNVATQGGQYFMQSSDTMLWPYGNPPTGGWLLIVYPLQTSYIPWFQGALGLEDSYVLSSSQGVYFVPTYGDYGALVLNISATGVGSLIVMRDPLFYPTSIEVTY